MSSPKYKSQKTKGNCGNRPTGEYLSSMDVVKPLPGTAWGSCIGPDPEEPDLWSEPGGSAEVLRRLDCCAGGQFRHLFTDCFMSVSPRRRDWSADRPQMAKSLRRPGGLFESHGDMGYDHSQFLVALNICSEVQESRDSRQRKFGLAAHGKSPFARHDNYDPREPRGSGWIC